MSIRELSPELKAKAKAELNEDEQRVKEDLAYIKEWLKKQPHLNVRQDDQWLLSFLRGCKFSLERTKEKLDFFYTMRSMLPELFANRDPMLPELQAVLKQGVTIPLSNTSDPTAPRVILFRGGCYDPNVIPMQDIYRANMMLTDILMMEDDTYMVNGMVLIQDLKDITLGHISNMTIAHKATTCFQQAYPTRPKGFHIFNMPSFFETIYNLMKGFLTEKLKSRMNVHTEGIDSVLKHVPLSILPKEYGGEGGSIDELTEIWKKKVESYREWFIEDMKYKADEKKRPGKPKTSDELFGIEGSFRKLTVD